MRVLLFILFPFLASGQSDINLFRYYTEFLNGVGTTADGLTPNEIFASVTGTGATGNSPQSTTTSSSVGVNRISCGTTTTGRVYIGSPLSAVRLGGGGYLYELKTTALSSIYNGTQAYTLLIGLFDATTANQVDGVYFLYDTLATSTGAASSDRWQCVTASNSSRTFSESTVDVSTSGAVFSIYINNDGTSVEFYINGTLQATRTTNIPIGSGRELGFGVMILKSAGTTAITMDLDYLLFTGRYDSQR